MRFLVAEPTIAKRIVRSKRTLASNQIPFEVPPPAERPAWLASVLEVLYLVFNEGYSAMAGDDSMRPALCNEALRLGRVLAELTPAEPEVHGLVALMEIQASRIPARLDPDGLPVPLPEQNRGRWDQLLIRRGFAALLRAERVAAGSVRPAGRDCRLPRPGARAGAHRLDPHRHAVSGACLADAVCGGETEPRGRGGNGVRPRAWPENRGRPGGGTRVGRLPHLPSVRGDLLTKLGRRDEAAAGFRRAASLTKNIPERTVLLRRAAWCSAPSQQTPA